MNGNGSIDMFPQGFIDYMVACRLAEIIEADRDRLIQEQVD
jgi:hypothetical protein